LGPLVCTVRDTRPAVTEHRRHGTAQDGGACSAGGGPLWGPPRLPIHPQRFSCELSESSMSLRDMASHDKPGPMSVSRTRAWGSLGSALLGAIVLSGCGTHTAPPVATKSDAAAVKPSVTQSVQRQIRERDKRIVELRSQIAELTSQLEALKFIDQDMSERRKPSLLPATLTPIETDQAH